MGGSRSAAAKALLAIAAQDSDVAAGSGPTEGASSEWISWTRALASSLCVIAQQRDEALWQQSTDTFIVNLRNWCSGEALHMPDSSKQSLDLVEAYKLKSLL